MKRFGLFILSAVAAACATVAAFDVMDAKAEAGVTVTVATMADAVKELKMVQAFEYEDTAVVYADAKVSIKFQFEKCSEQEWEEAWEGFTPEMLEMVDQELVDIYGVDIDGLHDLVTGGYFTTAASYRYGESLVMV